MRVSLFTLLAALIFALQPGAYGEEFRSFADDACGVKFDYPAEWTAELVSNSSVYDWRLEGVRCKIGLKSPNWDGFRERSALTIRPYAIEVVVVDAAFRPVAREVGFMTIAEIRAARKDPEFHASQNAREWTISGRQSQFPAYDFATECCQAVRGITWSHGTAKDGSTQSDFSDVAVLNDRQGHTAVVWADERFKPLLDQIETSLRLSPASN